MYFDHHGKRGTVVGLATVLDEHVLMHLCFHPSETNREDKTVTINNVCNLQRKTSFNLQIYITKRGNLARLQDHTCFQLIH